MNEQELKQLLLNADGPVEGLTPEQLVEGARRRVRRRRTVRRGAVGVMGVLLVGVGLWVGMSWIDGVGGPQVVIDQGVVADAEQELRRLEVEIEELRRRAEFHQLVADMMVELEERRLAEWRVEAALSRPGWREMLAREEERTALILVDHGDRLRRDFGELERAREEYRLAIRMFPGTHWAKVAEERLGEM